MTSIKLGAAPGAKSRHTPAWRSPETLTLAAMSVGYGVVQLDVTIVNVAVNSIGAAFGGEVAGLQWVVSSYTIAFAAFILSAGALGDRIGAKRVFAAGFAVFTLASLACALAPALPWLIAARAVQGLGAAILVPNSLALLNHAYRDERARGRAVGTWAAGASVALTAGPLVGGSLIALFGWRSIFLVNLPLGAVGLWLAWRYAKDTPRRQDRALDLAGQILAVVALGALAAALIEGGERGWTSVWVLASGAVAAAAIAGFVAREALARGAMLPPGLFRSAEFSATAAAGLLINTAFYGLIFVFSLYFQRAQHLTPIWTGLAFVPMTAACFAANLVAARVARWLGARIAIVAGGAAMAAGCAALLWIGPATAYGWILGPFLVIGAGLGLLVPPLTSALLGSVDKGRSGLASGVLNAARQTGSVLGVALMGALLAAGVVPGARISLALAVALAAATMAVVWLVLRPLPDGSPARRGP
jgi:DHA2 family methylenomycin A resistance protein-like MFS transporter